MPGFPEQAQYEHLTKLVQIYFASHGYIVPEIKVARTAEGDIVNFAVPRRSKLTVVQAVPKLHA